MTAPEGGSISTWARAGLLQTEPPNLRLHLTAFGAGTLVQFANFRAMMILSPCSSQRQVSQCRWAVHSNTNHIRVNMKSFAFLFILMLCTACVPQGLPVAESSPTLIATQFSIATIPPKSTSFPTSTTTALLLPSPTTIFDVVIDNVAIDQQGHLYASGFGKQDDLRHFARWDGGKWIELDNGFRTAGNSLSSSLKVL
jgi:hypothetical protein